MCKYQQNDNRKYTMATKWSPEKAERQRLRRANMTPEQVEAQRERSREYSKTKRVRPEGHKYNRQHRRRIGIVNPNHKAYSIQIGQVNYDAIYQAFFVLQEGKCAICGKHQDAENRRLALDHDHETGVVRGLLCFSCNGKLGWLELLGPQINDYLEWTD
jgi:hypothetical protein